MVFFFTLEMGFSSSDWCRMLCQQVNQSKTLINLNFISIMMNRINGYIGQLNAYRSKKDAEASQTSRTTKLLMFVSFLHSAGYWQIFPSG
jgi:hypothetical protein